MSSSILSIGESALAAAQAGLNTTGNNIANANTVGYSRQIVIQAASAGQDQGFGFQGSGTSVVAVQRVYSDFLAAQVLTTQSAKNAIDANATQTNQIDNLLSDSTVGLSPSLQDFFQGVQALSSDPNSAAARQSALSSAQTLAGSFQGLDAQLNELRQGANSQITTSIGTIDVLAKQIATLNDSISKAVGGATTSNAAPNDLLDQRDQAISDLSKEVKVTVVKQGAAYNVFIGSGQPLVVNTKTYNLVAMTSPTDPSRIEVGYQNNAGTIVLPENNFSGNGSLGGVIDFRLNILDQAQNALGRMAIGLATNMNAQQQLGQTPAGALGSKLFNVGVPTVAASTNNTGTAVVGASISNTSALTTSDYTVQYDGTNYNVTRLSDGAVTSFPTFPHTVDGVDFSLTSGVAATGDLFLVKPVAAGASSISVAISDPSEIATAAPIVTNTPATNTGSGKISSGSVDSNFTLATLSTPVTLTYNATTSKFSGFPVGLPVTVTTNGVATVYPAPPGAVPYTAGSTITFGGASVTITGSPATGDTFTIGPNPGGVGDNRNVLKMAALQTSNTLVNGTTNYQGAFAQLVSMVGNKAHELKVTGASATALYTQANNAQQSNSGVNLDEEATNLIRYQQAYQAAGKVMQTASTLFNLLLTLGQG